MRYGKRRGSAEPDASSPALEVENLGVSYPGARDPALEGASLCLSSGVRAALVGHNGSGKSTLLKAVTGLLPAHRGDIRIYGNPVGACHHRVAYLPQRGDIDWRFPINVRKLVLGGRYVHLGWLRRPGSRDRKAVEEVMERLGISGLAERQIGQLSGGQQQRALLARTLVQGADLLLLDEPLTAVDSETRGVILEVLRELRQQGKTLLVATHDTDRLENEYEGVLHLRDGRLADPSVDARIGGDFREGAAWAGF